MEKELRSRIVQLEQRVAEHTRQLQEQRALTRAITTSLAEGVCVMDPEGHLVWMNRAAEQLLDWQQAELLGADINAVVQAHRVDGTRIGGEEYHRPLPGSAPSAHAADHLFRRREGAIFPVEYVYSPIMTDEQVVGWVLIFRDMTEPKQAAKALVAQALHDDLTHLPNRTLLRDRLEQAVLAARRNQASLALLLMDLDRFKEINDTFGHQYGDLLLQQVGRRLGEVLRESDTVARLGGDEFAILLPTVIDRRNAMRVARKLLRALAKPFTVDGHLFAVEASTGIALYPQHGDDANTLLRHADIAMYAAKHADSGSVLYAPDQDQYSPDRLTLLSELRSAMEQDQLFLHYQPKVNLDARRVDGVEALLRWHHPEHGFIPPGEFIPLAEQTGLIKQLTLWVLIAALHQMQLWEQAGWKIPVAINLSARNLHDLRLVNTILALLRSHKIEAGMLALEITESALLADADRALKILTRLHECGVRISIDDFGTGYSSLASLRRLPVDEVKIDRSFVQGIVCDEDDSIIVRSIINLGHNLRHEVVAEGVEDAATWDLLATMGCDLVQGYYVMRPVPAVDLLAQLSRAPAIAEITSGTFQLYVIPPSGQCHV